MNALTVILAVLGLAGTAGAASAYFKRAYDKEGREIVQANYDSLKETIKIKDQRIAYLEAQVYEKDQIISRLAKGDKSSGR